MKLTNISADRTILFVAAYAPLTGRSDAEKDAFWQLLYAKTCTVPANDYTIITDDLNDHVDENTDGNKCHEGKGFGARRFCGHSCPSSYEYMIYQTIASSSYIL